MKLTIKSVFGFVAIIIVVLSTPLIMVSGAAIILTYGSLVFALLSMAAANKNILKIYGLVFIIAHLVLGWRMYDDISSRRHGYAGGVPEDMHKFESCRNKMFEKIDETGTELTPENKQEFERCMGN